MGRLVHNAHRGIDGAGTLKVFGERRLLVGEPVNDSASWPMRSELELLGVPGLIPAEDGIRDVVGSEFESDAGSPRVA